MRQSFVADSTSKQTDNHSFDRGEKSILTWERAWWRHRRGNELYGTGDQGGGNYGTKVINEITAISGYFVNIRVLQGQDHHEAGQSSLGLRA